MPTTSPNPAGNGREHARAPAEGRWSPDRIALLRRLWLEDGLSASEIAPRLGVSRNAVLGKVHRLGLSNRRPRQAPPPRPRCPQRRRSKPPVTSKRTLQPATSGWDAPSVGLAARVEDLTPCACRWPIGDPRAPAFGFCGRPAAAAPYCEAHRRVAYL